MKLKLLILLFHPFELWQAPQSFAERLQRDFPQIDVVHLPSYERVLYEVRDAEIVVGYSLRREQFREAKRLRWIHSTATGVHQLLYPELVQSDVVLTNARDVHGPVVAEHVIALVLALAKKLHFAAQYQLRGNWAQAELWHETPKPREIAGSTLGVIGFGAIGREVARDAKALGMRVVVVREHPERGGDNADAVYGTDGIERLLSEADYVVLAAPVTPATQHVLSAERLRLMKKDAYVINVARGSLIDEAELIAALREHRIGGAALDVFDQEPLPADSPLWELPNVLITPHTAAVTEKMWDRHYDLLARNLRRYLNREPLLNVVDKRKGY
jgi:D-2-hydroxyacid dehydrogenase (NADP+)